MDWECVGEVERNVGRERAQSPSEGLACKSHPKESVMRIFDWGLRLRGYNCELSWRVCVGG